MTLLHRLYASLLGYFWRPCPRCGREFGGHQWRDRGGHLSYIPVADHGMRGTAICPRCTRAGVGCRAWVGRQVHPGCEHLARTGGGR